MKEVFSYDDKGNIIGILELDSLETVQRTLTYEPKFDRYENLIYETKKIDGLLASLLEKEINYYQE